MDDQTEVIRQQMEGTRTALTDKLVLLEAQVSDKVQQATTTVSDTVESVSETVDNVKETVEDTVDAVKNAFDLNWHAKNHPWLLMGGAVLLGFVGGRMLRGPGRSHERRERAYSPPPPPPPPKPAPEKKSEEHSGGMLGRLSEEASGLKKVGIGMAMSVLREVVSHAVPPSIGPTLTAAVDGLTERLGGKPLGTSESDDNATKNHDNVISRMSQSGCETSC